MPRPERPVDPADGVVARFALELRTLRQDAGSPTYRQLAAGSGYSITTLSHAAGGRRLPSLEVALAYAVACGGDRDEWSARWHAAAVAVAGERPAEPDRPPYVGSREFRAADADLLFGRDRLIDDIVARCAATRVVVVRGASGAGVSSLLAAGVLPALRARDVHAVVATSPAEPSVDEDLVIVDGPDDADDVIEVGPMSADELREAISRPAAAVGLSVERALLATAVNDTEGRPGALPLLSHAMLETWRQRRGEVLTLAGYQAAGGVRGAACTLAEATLDRLPAPSRDLAADLLLRLVSLAGDVAAPRRGVPLAELRDIDRDAGAVLTELAGARLVTISGDTVELTHEALVEDWNRLREWISADRAGLRIHHELTEAVRVWAVDHDPSALYRGTRLITTAEWLHRPGRRVRLTESERAFLDASSAAESRQLATQRRRTVQLRRLSIALALFAVVATVATVVAAVSAHQVSEASKEVRSRQLAAEARLLAPTDVAAAQRKAVDAYLAAPTDEARGVVLSLAGRQNFHGRLAGHTGTVNALAITPNGATMVSGGDDGTAIVWDIHARQAKHTLRSAGEVRDVAISPDGATIAVAGRNGTLSLWRLADGRRLAELSGHTGSVESVAYDKSGETLVSLDSAGAAIIWDTGSRMPRARLATHGGMNSAFAISPRGDTVAVAAGDGSVTGYDLVTGRVTEQLSVGPVPLYAVAFHPRDGSLVAAGKPETLFVWDRNRDRQDVPTETDGQVHDLTFADGGTLYCGCGRETLAWNPATQAPEGVLGARTGAVYSVAASADGSVTASAGADGAVLLWTRTRLPLLWHTEGVRGVAISQDGATLASGSGDGTVARWNTADRTLETVHTGHTREVNAVDVSPDGRLIASASNDHTVRLWRADSASPPVLGHPDQVRTVSFSQDGHWLATGAADGRVLRWDVENPDTPTELQRHDRAVHTLAFSQDGHLLASAGRDGEILLTDLSRSETSSLNGHKGRIDTLAFSPDGQHVAAGGADGDIMVWDISERSEPWRLRGHSQPVTTLAFSPDGRFLASGGDETSVIIWDFPGRSRWTTLSGHADKVVSAVWSPNSATLYTGGADRVVIPWVVDTDAALASIRAQLATGFPTS